MKKIYIGSFLERPELSEVESTGKIVDEYWEQTNHGPLIIGALFPVSRLPELEEWVVRVNAAREALNDATHSLFKISREP